MPEAKSGRVYKFGLFEADTRSGELRKGGARVRLQEQPFQVLALLLEQPGEVVSREQVRVRLWPSDTFVDFDHGVNTAVKKLRQALGDDADNPRFVETLPRRGYRFLAPVQVTDPRPILVEDTPTSQSVPGDEEAREWPAERSETKVDEVAEQAIEFPAAPPQSATSASTPASGGGNRRRLIAVTAAVVFVIALAAVFRGMRTREVPGATPTLNITPLTSLPGAEMLPRLSPDGTRVFFVHGNMANKSYEVMIRSIGTEGMLHLATGDPETLVVADWSRDGERLVLLKQSRAGASLFVAPSLGGSERLIAELPNAGFCASISWSPDEKRVLFTQRLNPDGPTAVFEIGVDGTGLRPLTSPPPLTAGDSDPLFSPDGKMIAFVRDTRDAPQLWVMNSDGSGARQISREYRNAVAGLAWVPDGSAVLFGGPQGIFRAPLDGGRTENVVTGMAALSPTIANGRLVFAGATIREHVWAVKLKDGKAASQEPVAMSSRQEQGAQFSPDGKSVVFQSTRSGNFEIWRAHADGTGVLQLTNLRGPVTGTPRWSPDGAEIVFDSRPNGNADILVVGANGQNARPVVAEQSNDAVPSFSRDGRWIYFASDRGGTWNVWKIPRGGGAPVQVTRDGGFAPMESPDGKYLYYAKGIDKPGLWRVPVAGGEPEAVVDDLQPHLWGYWAVTNSGVYFARFKDAPEIHYLDFATKRRSLVASFDKPFSAGAPGLGVSGDGKTLLVTLSEPIDSDLYLAEPFK